MTEQPLIPEAYELTSTWIDRALRGLGGEIAATRRAFRPSPGTRFVIFAQGRTGSQLLTNTLNKHPDIRCEGEILRKPRVAPLTFVANRAKCTTLLCFGFKVKIYQLYAWQRVRDPGLFLSSLHSRGWKIIYLWRENLLEHVISNRFAVAANQYHFGGNRAGKRPDQIYLCPNRVLTDMEGRRSYMRREREALARVPFLELNYERDLRSSDRHNTTFNRIQEYLGVNVQELSPTIQKSVHKPMNELIKNFDEIHSALSGTSFERYLAAEAA